MVLMILVVLLTLTSTIFISKLYFIKGNKTLYKGTLPVRLLGLFTTSSILGTSSDKMAAYMRRSNNYSIAIWILIGFVLVFSSIVILKPPFIFDFLRAF